MKIIINKCFGGYSVSDEAIKRWAEIKGITLFEYHTKGWSDTYFTTLPITTDQELSELKGDQECFSGYSFDSEEMRTDPALIQAVEELGEKANGQFASLVIVDVPDDGQWYIDDYDGVESVHEAHRSW